MNDREKTLAAIDILSSLIISNGRQLGSEQHNPGLDADHSDDIMKERELVVKELREIRGRLENLLMGVI